MIYLHSYKITEYAILHVFYIDDNVARGVKISLNDSSNITNITFYYFDIKNTQTYMGTKSFVYTLPEKLNIIPLNGGLVSNVLFSDISNSVLLLSLESL